MIRVVFFDLGQTLLDAQRKPFPHVPQALTAIAGFHTAAGKPLRSALVSDWDALAPPLTPARIQPLFDAYLAILAASGLQPFFEPVARRVTLSTHAGVTKPQRGIFDKALQRLRVKATLDECLLVTEDAAHVDAVRSQLGMAALRFGSAGTAGVDFSDWSQAPALLAHRLGTHDGPNLQAAIAAHLAAHDVEATDIQAGEQPGEFQVGGKAWHPISVPGRGTSDPLMVAVPTRARVRRGPHGELKLDLPAADPAALAEARDFVGSLAAHGQIAGLAGQVKSATHAIETDPQGRPRLVRKRFSAL